MTDSLLPSYENPKQTLSWPRIAGTAFAIALHVVVFMTLMAPVTPAQKAEEDEDVTLVSFIEPPPPPRVPTTPNPCSSWASAT
jgi:protein TonB